MSGFLAKFALALFDKAEELLLLASGQSMDVLKDSVSFFGHKFHVTVNLTRD